MFGIVFVLRGEMGLWLVVAMVEKQSAVRDETSLKRKDYRLRVDLK